MKIILIAQELELKKKMEDFFTPLGHALIHYTNPLKGMNNFTEIQPRLVLFNSADYPRHWKIAHDFLQRDTAEENPLFFLLIAEDFPMEEVCKARYLGINALISDDWKQEGYFDHLKSLIGRFHSTRITKPALLAKNIKGEFGFMNPDNFRLTTGSLEEFDSYGGGFRPDDPKSVFTLKKGTILETCSLRTDEGFITIKAEILDNNGVMDLKFLDFADNGRNLLEKYLNR